MPPPPTPGTTIQQAARHLAEGRPTDAVRALEALAEAVPAYVTAHVLLAKAYEACGRRPDALAAWHRAYFLMPGSALVARQRARLLRAVPPEEHPEPERPAALVPDEEPLAPAWNGDDWGEPAWDDEAPPQEAPAQVEVPEEVPTREEPPPPEEDIQEEEDTQAPPPP